MFLYISPSTVCNLSGNQTFCGYHSCADEHVICGHFCSSLSMKVLVATPSIVSLEYNGSINSRSSFAKKIGDYTKWLSWNVIPYARIWLGFTRVLSMVSPIHISLLSIRIMVSYVSELAYSVGVWTIGTAFMISYSSVYGATSHSLPVKCMTMQLDPQTIEFACDSISIVL